MENRFQYLLLKHMRYWGCAAFCIAGATSPANALDIDTEFFEVGISSGVINVEDYTSEFTIGINATFRSTENFFLQLNYFQTDVSESIAESELIGAQPFSGKRGYKSYNMLLGYNLFQGEIFRGSSSGLSSLYAVLGVGDTEFLDDASFTWIYGLGYRIALSRRVMMNFDFRQYQYDFTAVLGGAENSSTNSHLSVGFGWLF